MAFFPFFGNSLPQLTNIFQRGETTNQRRLENQGIASGKRLHGYGKSAFDDKSTTSGHFH